jgi:hypothetical protein
MAHTYFVRLDGTKVPQYVPLVRDDLHTPYLIFARTGADGPALIPACGPMCTDDQKIMGAFLLNGGRQATLRDIQEGRAKDISWDQNSQVVLAEYNEIDSWKVVEFCQEHFEDYLNRLSGGC